ISELTKWLKENTDKPRLEVVLHADLRLENAPSSEEGVAILAQGREVIFRAPEDSPRRPSIRLTYRGGKTNMSTALQFKNADQVTLKGLRLVLDSAENGLKMTGIHFLGGRQ